METVATVGERTISVEELRSRLESGEPIVMDVREYPEYAEGTWRARGSRRWANCNGIRALRVRVERCCCSAARDGAPAKPLPSFETSDAAIPSWSRGVSRPGNRPGIL